MKRKSGESAPKDLDVSKCRSGAGAGRRSKVRYNPNNSLRRQVASQWPRPGGRQCMIADLDRKRTAEEMNRAIAVIHGRLGMSRDKGHRPGVVAAGRLIGVR